MTVKRLIAIAIVFVGAFVAWMILGVSNLNRTDSSYRELKKEVSSLYGGSLIIHSPNLSWGR